jgi:hypothetical protein
VAELTEARDLGSCSEKGVGSSPMRVSRCHVVGLILFGQQYRQAGRLFKVGSRLLIHDLFRELLAFKKFVFVAPLGTDVDE